MQYSTSPCRYMALSKYVRCVLHATGGSKILSDGPTRKDKKKRRKGPPGMVAGGVSVEISSSSSTSSVMHRDSVVRVVLAGGVVELYTGVIMAVTVMEKHPGLCVVHPEVFKNPHRAIVSPREPLFPGQKFYLLPKSTLDKLQRKIPESSARSAAPDVDDDSSDVPLEEPGKMDLACFSREYNTANEQWSECQFKKTAARARTDPAGEEQATSAEETAKPRPKAKQNQQQQREAGTPPATARKTVATAAATPRRVTWEPSLPSVQEESSP